MSHFLEDEQRRLQAQEVGYALAMGRDPKTAWSQPPRKPPQPEKPTPPHPPIGTEQFIRSVEQSCEDCYGTGRDMGHPGHPFEAGDCSHCGGIGREIVTRNFLSEALAIAANAESTRIVEREHLVALCEYARMFVSASLMLPDVELPPKVAA